MFDILVYLFETYFNAEDFHYPDQDALALKLSAAGFDSDEITQALDWLSGLETLSQGPYPDYLADSDSFRVYAEQESSKIDSECRGFLAFLETSGILNPIQREWVIDRVLALSEEEVTLEKVKWTVLIVLWSQGQAQDYLFLEELLFGDATYQMH
jgi:Smg protein